MKYRIKWIATAGPSNAREPMPVEGDEVVEAADSATVQRELIEHLTRHGFTDYRILSCRKTKRPVGDVNG